MYKLHRRSFSGRSPRRTKMGVCGRVGSANKLHMKIVNQPVVLCALEIRIPSCPINRLYIYFCPFVPPTTLEEGLAVTAAALVFSGDDGRRRSEAGPIVDEVRTHYRLHRTRPKVEEEMGDRAAAVLRCHKPSPAHPGRRQLQQR